MSQEATEQAARFLPATGLYAMHTAARTPRLSWTYPAMRAIARRTHRCINGSSATGPSSDDCVRRTETTRSLPSRAAPEPLPHPGYAAQHPLQTRNRCIGPGR